MVDGKEEEVVWIACRSTSKPGCKGNQAVVVFRQRKPGGGCITRYRCRTCNGPFHIEI